MQDQDEKRFRVMELFIANAKTYIQLGSGALLLSVAFAREILGTPEERPIPIDPPLVAAWGCFLVAIIAGAFYQYLAVRFLESSSRLEVHHAIDWPRWLIDNPWLAYGVMMAAFYGGACFFTAAAVLRLR